MAETKRTKGISPLDVLLSAMAYHSNIADKELAKPEGQRNQQRLEAAMREARDTAEKAAPYLHSRKATVAVADVTPQLNVIRAPAAPLNSQAWLEQHRPPGDPNVNDRPAIASSHLRKAVAVMDAIDEADRVIDGLKQVN